VLVEVAVMLADGGEVIGDINMLHHQGQVLGSVASAPTAWRAHRPSGATTTLTGSRTRIRNVV
jgi:hypothetical protein